MNSIKARIITALVLLAIVAVAIYFKDQYGLHVLGYLVSAIAIFEYQQMMLKDFSKILRVVFYFTTACVFYVSFLNPSLALPVCLISFVLNFAISCLLIQDLPQLFRFMNRIALGHIYTGFMFALLCYLSLSVDDGMIYLLMALVCVIASDVGAFAYGIWRGKTKLHPVSPNKTKEGSIAGLALSTLAGPLMVYLFSLPHSLHIIAVVFLIASVFSQAGDLFESLLKRSAGVKDSGKILPGHGGVLDRLDSLIFAAPIFLVYALI